MTVPAHQNPIKKPDSLDLKERDMMTDDDK